jgi:hypothetical protein
MKASIQLKTSLLVLLTVICLEARAMAFTDRVKSAAKQKAKAVVTNNTSEARLAEDRVKLAEERARLAELAADKAQNDAKAAQEQAAQAVAAARHADEMLTQMQQTISRLEEAINHQAKEPVALNTNEVKKTEAVQPEKAVEAKAAKPAQGQTAQADSPVTTVSKMPLKLYGSILFNSGYLDKGANNLDVPLFSQKRNTAADQNHQTFNMTARQSRFGMRYEGKAFKEAKLTGVLEFDLFGGKPAFANGEHFDLMRLRLAYARLDWQKDSLEVGQDWSVFAPLNPTTIASYAIPGFATSGNLWYRMPQIRYEHREKVGDKTNLVLTTALLDPNAGDNSGNPAFRAPGLGERGALPAFEARFGVTTQAHERESAIGVSSHYSRFLAVPGSTVAGIAVTTRSPIDSYGVNLDANLWLSSGVRVTGELFHGRALGIFSGNVAQVANVVNGRAIGINTNGGWFEFHAEAPKRYDGTWKNFSANAGYGAEDNRDANLSVGLRKRNQTFLGNGQYKFSPYFTLSLEYRHLHTEWFKQATAAQSVNWANLGLLFSF